jgi:ABC-type Na+ efflux pump permease subunit
MVNLLKIARWEFQRSRSSAGRRVAAASLLALLAIALSLLALSTLGFHTEDNLYRVILDDPQLAGILERNSKFDVVLSPQPERMFQEGGFDLLISGRHVSYSDSEKSIAALDALDKTIQEYDEARLVAKKDIANAFPVWVTINYLPRLQSFQIPSASPQRTPPAQERTLRSDEISGEKREAITPESVDSLDKLGERRIPFELQNVATPSHIEPPIPFRSVVLTFFFIFPMYFVAQFYSASIMNERVRRRGVVLLSSPLHPSEIVLGKMLPYLAVTLVLVLLLGFGMGGNLLILPLLLPVVLMFLSTSFLAAIIARSFKELTFVLVFLSVTLSGYLFFPAMFVNLHVVSSISPMSLVVKVIEGEKVGVYEYLFSSAPLYLVSLLVFVFGILIYREEDLFSQKPIPAKLLSSVEEFLFRLKGGGFAVFSLSALLVPFAFIVELMAIVALFNLPVQVSVVFFVLIAAVTEETLKSLGVYALLEKDTSLRQRVFLGSLSGLGFFAGEKLIVLVVLLSLADSVFGAAMGIGLLLFPFLLHLTSTTLSATLMRRNRVRFAVSVLLATALHSAYNLYLLRGVIHG